MSADKETRERYRLPRSDRSPSLLKGFTSGDLSIKGNIWTDGWYLFASNPVLFGIPVRFNKKFEKVPYTECLGARAFNDIWIIVPPAKTFNDEETKRTIQQLSKFSTDLADAGFRVKESFKIFSRPFLEKVLVDIDVYMEETPGPHDDLAGTPIQTTYYLLDMVERGSPWIKNPSWVRDEKIWEHAKKTVLLGKKKYDEPYAVITTVYKKMGGRIKK